jgi:hypothetical protein
MTDEIDPSNLSCRDVVRGLIHMMYWDSTSKMYSPSRVDRVLSDPKKATLMLEAIYTFLADSSMDPWTGENATDEAKASRFLLPLLGRYIKAEEFDAPLPERADAGDSAG